MQRALFVSLSLLVIVALVPVSAWATSEPSSDAAVPASSVVSDDPDDASGVPDPDAGNDDSRSAASSDAGSDAASEWVVYELTPVSSVNDLLSSAIDIDGSVYNGTGYKAGERLSSSGTPTQ